MPFSTTREVQPGVEHCRVAGSVSAMAVKLHG